MYANADVGDIIARNLSYSSHFDLCCQQRRQAMGTQFIDVVDSDSKASR
jgi:hypothetical protein